MSVCLYSLSPSLPCAVVCFVCHKSRVFCVHFGGKLQVVVRRFVALFNLDKLKTMPHLPHATHTLATWGTKRGGKSWSCQHFAQVASAKGASPRSYLPRLFIAAERNKLRLRGKPPLPHSPVWHMQHAPCATYVQSMRQQLKRKTKKENAMGQLATCHLPHTLGAGRWQALLSVWQLKVRCLICQGGGKGARGRGRLNRWAPLATRLSSGRQF